MGFDIDQPNDSTLPSGTARSPGPSTQDMIATDRGDLPDALRQEQAAYLGDNDLPWSRYTSTEFYDLEMSRMWSKTWQWACRSEQLAQKGDFYVYDIGHYSVLIVRESTEKIRAFINSCPHRGMQFCDSGTQGQAKQFIRCPFHGMSWQLNGDLRDIPCRWDFPHIDEQNFNLTPVNCDVWGGFVFINLDEHAQPLTDYLEVLPEHFAHWPLEQRYTVHHTEKILPGNWKMCMEGFLEAYHVLGTHPEAMRTSAWANTQYDCFSPNVTRFFQVLAGGNPQYEKPLSEAELFKALGHSTPLPQGATARQAHAAELRHTLGAQMRVDLSHYSDSEMLDSIEYHLFPNACFFPGINIPLIYRFRPLGVDRCIHDILMLQPLPEQGDKPQSAQAIRLGLDDNYVDVPTFGPLAYVLDQDTENFRRQWAGVRASSKGTQTLGLYQESRIRHFHATLDTYLAS